MTETTWNTWSRQHSTDHDGVIAPRSVFEAQEIVEQIATTGGSLKVIGASRSSSAIAQPTGTVLSLEYLTGLTAIDVEGCRATFLAGTTVADANKILLNYGLAFENLGRLGQQTLAGAISTGTHGTGLGFGIFPTQVESLTLLTSTGELVTCSAELNPEIFSSALVGLGALGIIVSVTFRVVPLFRLHAAERGHFYDKIIGSFEERSRGADHYEFSWFPGSKEVRTRRLARLPLLPEGFLRPDAKLSQARRHGGDMVLNDGIFQAMSFVGTKIPASQKALNKVSNWGKGNRRYADYAPRVFTLNRRVPQNNMEYAFDLADFENVMQAVKERLADIDVHPTYPIVVRTAAADNIPLSQAYGRETFYVSAREYWRKPYEAYFNALEEVFTEFGGRPHWGQKHSLDAASLEKLYPRFSEFTSLREEMDPEGMFLNPYLQKVLLP